MGQRQPKAKRVTKKKDPKIKQEKERQCTTRFKRRKKKCNARNGNTRDKQTRPVADACYLATSSCNGLTPTSNQSECAKSVICCNVLVSYVQSESARTDHKINCKMHAKTPRPSNRKHQSRHRTCYHLEARRKPETFAGWGAKHSPILAPLSFSVL